MFMTQKLLHIFVWNICLMRLICHNLQRDATLVIRFVREIPRNFILNINLLLLFFFGNLIQRWIVVFAILHWSFGAFSCTSFLFNIRISRFCCIWSREERMTWNDIEMRTDSEMGVKGVKSHVFSMLKPLFLRRHKTDKKFFK